MVTTLKDKLKLIGIDPQDYSAHSFRRGGASYAFHAKADPLAIKKMGDWKSSAYEIYVEMDMERRLDLSQKIADTLEQELHQPKEANN